MSGPARRSVDRPADPPGSGPACSRTGVYGGYFGAAQGVLLLGLLGIGLDEPLPRINALKNVLAMLVNGVAGVVFILVSHVDWPVAVAIAVGSVLGAQLGARVGRRLPPTVYRVVIVASASSRSSTCCAELLRPSARFSRPGAAA